MLERGQLTLQDYLSWTLFYESLPFTLDEIIEAIEKLSTPIAETLDLIRSVAMTKSYSLMTINNESRELNEYRIERFGLHELFSAFFTSCYLGIVKPHPDAYRRAMEIAHRRPNECLFVDDRPMNVEVHKFSACGQYSSHPLTNLPPSSRKRASNGNWDRETSDRCSGSRPQANDAAGEGK